MPINEYRCRKCENAFEVLTVGKSTDAAVTCPACSSAAVDRLIGLPSSTRTASAEPATNCRGDGPPCGAPYCGRKR